MDRLQKAGLSRLIPPHGGRLVDRRVSEKDKPELLRKSTGYPTVTMDRRALSDLMLIANGAFSPLRGFMTQDNYQHCLRDLRLADGTVWPLPVTLPVSDEEAAKLGEWRRVTLADKSGRRVGVMELLSVYWPDKLREARLVFGTTDPKHPGVAALISRGKVYLGGPVYVFPELFSDIADTAGIPVLSPAELRAEFSGRGWAQVVGFQTRNPLHRVHEHIQKCALEVVDGLLLHPLVGETKKDDVPVDVRAQTYRAALAYFPAMRVVLSGFPAFMRYAGPREALFHALVRRNYGCSHFIVGRDHAGVGDYYDPLDAHRIFGDFCPEEIGITPLRFDAMFYCVKCGAVVSHKTCPHGDEYHIESSGTRVRQMLASGELPPPEVTRPEVAVLLKATMDVHAG